LSNKKSATLKQNKQRNKLKIKPTVETISEAPKDKFLDPNNQQVKLFWDISSNTMKTYLKQNKNNNKAQNKTLKQCNTETSSSLRSRLHPNHGGFGGGRVGCNHEGGGAAMRERA